MERFYFHTHTNGTLIKDPIGQWFDAKGDACINAVGLMPLMLERALRGAQNTYITTEMCNRTRALCIIRATIVTEQR
jgi:hypothetical protein